MSELWNRIKCPYCFKEFAHDKVHFRISENASKLADNKFKETENSIYNNFKKREQSDIDPKYEIVWGHLRGGNPPDKVKESFLIPWVDENNKDEMITGDYKKDKDGFVELIKDKLEEFESKTRICPHCHNKLPLHYGKNPQIFISILGVTASGKTVFIKQLLSKFRDALQDGILNHVGGSFIELTLPEDENSYLDINKPLPDSTKDLDFKIPYFITMMFNKEDVTTKYDFVIYDIAGERLVKTSENDFDFFGGFIKKSDAIIMLIDPKQLISFPPPLYPANQMISTLYSIFGNEINIPAAITITKSDLLLSNSSVMENLNPNGEYFNNNSVITKNIQWNPNKKFFYKDDHSKLFAQLNRFLNEKAGSFNSSVNNFVNQYSYFAVSALFEGVDQKLTFELTPKKKWESNIIDNLINKYKVFNNELIEIKQDLIEQENNPSENIINASNIPPQKKNFTFEQSDEIYKKLNYILGNISTLNALNDIRGAVYKEFSKEEVLKLHSSDENEDYDLSVEELISYIRCLKEQDNYCNFEICIQSYPRSNGQLKSLRIEEPFFWLLSELNVISSGNLKDIVSPEKKEKKGILTRWRK